MCVCAWACMPGTCSGVWAHQALTVQGHSEARLIWKIDETTLEHMHIGSMHGTCVCRGLLGVEDRARA